MQQNIAVDQWMIEKAVVHQYPPLLGCCWFVASLLHLYMSEWETTESIYLCVAKSISGMDQSYVPACGERTGVCVCCCGSGGGGWLGGGGGWLGGGGADKRGGGRPVLGWGWVLGPKIQFSPSLCSTDVVLWLPELLPFRWNKENSRHLVTHEYSSNFCTCLLYVSFCWN